MRRIIYVLLASAVVLAVVWYLAGLPGDVTAQLGDTTIQLATPLALAILLICFILLYVLLRLLGALWRLPRTTARWNAARHRRLGDVAVTKALLALAAGDRADARREAGRARRWLGETPQTLLLVASAARLAGRDDEAEVAFRQLSERNDAAFLGYRGLLRQAVAREDWGEAASLAARAEATHPGASWLRQERARLAIRAGRWSEALELGDTVQARAALAAAAAEVEHEPARALQLARQAWKDDPSLAPATLAYAKRLRADGREKRAQAVIRHSWALAPHPELADFALAPVSDPLARAKAAQRLTEANPQHVESRLLLARTALEAGLTGEARHQAEAARDAGLNQRRLWLLLAEIAEAEQGGGEAGQAAQRELLRRAANADPDPAWQCQECHTTAAAWQPACPSCGAAGGLRWSAAGRAGAYPVPAIVAQ